MLIDSIMSFKCSLTDTRLIQSRIEFFIFYKYDLKTMARKNKIVFKCLYFYIYFKAKVNTFLKKTLNCIYLIKMIKNKK